MYPIVVVLALGVAIAVETLYLPDGCTRHQPAHLEAGYAIDYGR